MSTLKQLWQWGSEELAANGIEESRLDAWYIIEEIFQITRAYYYVHTDDPADDRREAAYRQLIQKRAQRIPLQQILGKGYFMGLEFKVNRHVLAPRQDTEILVEEALKRVQPHSRILDMCTGSGCILLSLLHYGEALTGVGADLSEDALQVARENAERICPRAQLLHSDLFDQVEGQFDAIVSNPPYIPTKVIDGLMPEVRDHEPKMALDGLEDGLYFYREITQQAGAYLKDGGWLMYEIGAEQGEDVSRLMKEAGYRGVQVVQDLAGLDRVVLGQKEQ